MFFKKKVECKPGSHYRQKFNAFLKSKGETLLSDSAKLGYISVDQYTICNTEVELITDTLNYCIGLGISLNDKVFLAHISRDKNKLIKSTSETIKKEFGVERLNLDGIKLKVWLGDTSDTSSAVYTILKLLSKLDLLELFSNNIQRYMSNNYNDFLDIKLQNYKVSVPKCFFFKKEKHINLDEFLSKKTIKNDSEILLIAEFINNIKNKFENVSIDCALVKIGFNDFARTNDLVTLQVPLSPNLIMNQK